jgi:DNA repair photolyase
VIERQPCDDGWGSLDQAVDAQALPPATRVLEEQVKTILAGNDSPDIGFDLSINPYRGCEHGCIYCYARPTHSYLNLSPGLDFETRIVAKVNAARAPARSLSARSYSPMLLNIGSATDAYQPAERKLRITRSGDRGLQRIPPSVLADHQVGRRRARHRPDRADGGAHLAAVYVSITTLDPALARVMEPRAAAPERRLQTIRKRWRQPASRWVSACRR